MKALASLDAAQISGNTCKLILLMTAWQVREEKIPPSSSLLLALCDNNNLILKLREELTLSFSVFAKKHEA